MDQEHNTPAPETVLPSAGGSYLRNPDGSLTPIVPEPAAAESSATNTPPDQE